MAKVFAVYDSKVKTYMNPHHFKTVGEAVRTWVDIVNDTQTLIGRHPEDYTLMELADYDEETGKFTNQPTPISHGLAIEFVRDKDFRGPKAVE